MDRIQDERFDDINLPLVVERYVFRINLYAFKNYKIAEGRRTKILAALSIQLIGLNQKASYNELVSSLQLINNTICAIPLARTEVINIMKANYDRYLKDGIGPWLKYRKRRYIWWHSRTSNDGETKKALARIFLRKYRTKKYQNVIAASINEIMLQGRETVTKKRVSSLANLHIKVVYKHWPDIHIHVIEEYNSNLRSVLKILNRKTKKVSLIGSKNLPCITLLKKKIIRTEGRKQEPKDDTFCTFSKIETAIHSLMAKNEAITQTIIANATGFSVITIKRYWKHFKSVVGDYKKGKKPVVEPNPKPVVVNKNRLAAMELLEQVRQAPSTWK